MTTVNKADYLPPLVVNSADELKWDDEADVVVVGFGGAGAAAAIEARDNGASVIAVDRFDGGGATAYSGGVVYAGATRYLKESGYDDTPEEMYKYLDAEKNAVGPETLRRFCEGSSGDMDWLDQQGVPHAGNPFEDKTSFPPDNHFLYYSGNEKMPEFAALARPAPRGHRVAINGFGGRVLFDKLRDSALAKQVKLLRHAPVRRLVTDANGAVIGVEANVLPESLHAKHQSLYKVVHPWRPFNGDRAERAITEAKAIERSVEQPRLIRARGGVVITTGGFNHNREMIRQHRPELGDVYKILLRLGSMGDDGGGMKLAESAGGATALMDRVSVARTLVPPNVFAHGIVVNQHGKRFVNEAAYGFNVGNAITQQPGGGKAWLLLEGKTFWRGVKDSFLTGKNFLIWGAPALLNIALGGTRRANTLEELARKIQVDPAGVSATVAEVNTLADSGAPDPLHKLDELIKPLRNGPFYAVNLSLDNKFMPAQTMTVGGIKVNEESGAALRDDDSDLPGLYAAGRAAVGVCSGGFISGLSLADCIFSGRRAGRSAAQAASLTNEEVNNAANL